MTYFTWYMDQSLFGMRVTDVILESAGVKTENVGDDLYRVNVEKTPDPVYLRFANGYAYAAARDRSALDKDRLLAPGVVMPAGSRPSCQSSYAPAVVPSAL